MCLVATLTFEELLDCHLIHPIFLIIITDGDLFVFMTLDFGRQSQYKDRLQGTSSVFGAADVELYVLVLVFIILHRALRQRR